MSEADRLAQVWGKLAGVTDPELDKSVTELRFVTDVMADATGAVSLRFRLPTYWCAANFAFMMADDMRRAVAALPWVHSVDVRLGEHMYADTINDGLARKLSFEQAFGGDADGNLDALRRTFLVKAFQRRQEALLRHLLTCGLGADVVAAMPLVALDALTLSDDGERLRARYLERRDVCADHDEPRAFVDAHGAALGGETLPAYLQALGRVGVNAEFNGALCRGLLAARFDAPSETSGEPGLHHFLREARREQGLAETAS